MTDSPIELHTLLERFGPMLARIVGSYEYDPGLRQDLLQEVALAIWRGLRSYRQEGSLKGYIARIARNRCLTHVARQARAPRMGELDENLHSETDSPEELAERDLKRTQLEQRVRNLPLEQREVIVLYLEDFKQREIAEALGISENAVALRISRARSALTKATL